MSNLACRCPTWRYRFNRTILRKIANQEMQGFENLQVMHIFLCEIMHFSPLSNFI